MAAHSVTTPAHRLYGDPQELEAMRRGYDHGRYIALMDLSHFLSNDNVEALLPSTEVVLNRPPTGQNIGPSMNDQPSTSTSRNSDPLAPPAPPFPRLMKNLLKDRRRFQRQLVTSSAAQSIDYDKNIVIAAHKALENFQLKALFEKESSTKRNDKVAQFSSDLLYATMSNHNSTTDQ